ncbi:MULTISPECIES: ABC transporter ATP-binding protein [Alkalihalophilus]|jgi:peptide/nickel transport system ATP-binding protein/oligopeptide transport system ATP-binding protein|uniref:Dipeptide ABC transporter ATP-binding protein n=2 Tax=Alkalihalophilus TaxID=2893060 RepID=A0AAJ2NPW3_ALKPS|nr:MULTISPECIES: dipeptide ABC transporter ATP-binding protein [Alkalihalophilus]ERN51989.1 peptide ABC transporter substrate-binding protein [Alkalihalophilus marmarensis DSM 21297]MCM3489945.1 dipeptide ABC transporter ATP-binding protein [Alkalihalophilus marmarensis]MDV2886303.1 dipeptide ABC transporter ATP-binding protein [Alkalihalophilus pseudofirmus]MEC2071283.1 dipeptide ABC transporter ATP-binding protein [Alkalihalophilus marmarensis]MED1603004.1 dipeptide ABC transporter ATP-bindi
MSTQLTDRPNTGAAKEKDILLEVNGLKKHFPIKKGMFQRTVGHVKAVDDISFFVRKGETFGLVGESGCGKSTTGRTLMRLYEPTAGQIIFDGKDISNMKERELHPFRKDIQMVFQDPFSSLNPRKTVQTILREPLNVHGMYKGKARQEYVEELMEKVGLNPAYANRYPHEFSGGQRQRIGIARALTLNPKLIIGDEPVSALDVSVQSQVLNLFKDLQDEFGLTYLFIAHDLGVVKHISDRIGVMYLGKMMEVASKKDLYADPLHPYTQALLSAVPRSHPTEVKRERIILTGEIPSPSNPPTGCVFHTRCPMAMDECKQVTPAYREVKKDHFVACHLYK